MNNYKMNYAKKYHYMIKYFIMAFPLILLLICCFNVKDSLSINLNYLSTYIYNIVDTNSIVSWYKDILNLFEMQLSNSYLIFVQIMPIWIIAVYFFDMLIDVLVLIPRLVHKWINRIGGDY